MFWQPDLACDFWCRVTLKSSVYFDYVDYIYITKMLLCFSYLFIGRDGSSDFAFQLVHFPGKFVQRAPALK